MDVDDHETADGGHDASTAALDELLRRQQRTVLDRARALLPATGGTRWWIAAAIAAVVAIILAVLFGAGVGQARRAEELLPVASAEAPGGVAAASESTARESAAGDAAAAGPDRAGPAVAEGVESGNLGAKTVVVVHVAGAVVTPGVVRLTDAARVADAVAAAGGPAPDADLDRVNLAAPLTDGVQVVIPRVGEVLLSPVAPGPVVGSATSPPAPVDLNAAGSAELDTLPGVGPSTAAAIIGYREEHGGFRSVDDLLEVRGIGEVRMEQLRPLVTVARR